MTTQDAKALGWLAAALGNEPFPWQRALLARMCEGTLPRALDLPTGLGKTSVMAIWLMARAAGQAKLPRRLVYVVDRRAVVDQATRVAEELRETVAQAADLREALGLEGRALPISTLRGQHVDNREWLEDPASPAIVVGTVDMIGSRLLFEGYACSRKMRPYHAGLLGSDTLFVLDEAHLVPPFERLIEQAAGEDALGPEPARRASVPPLRVLSLSATGREHGAGAFRFDADRDLAHPVVRQRIEGAKALRVLPLDAKAKLHERAAEEAWRLACEAEEPTRVIVFCALRDDAEKAKLELLKLARQERGRGADLPPAELLVGGRRTRERSHAAERLRALGFLAGSTRPHDHAFVFATSAGEVGVDLDADHMVCDVVAYERMVQRLGRVNRRGERAAEVVVLAEDVGSEGSGAASGEAEPASGAAGKKRGGAPEWASRVVPLLRRLPICREDGARDASLAALMKLRREQREAIAAASTPEPQYPALSRAVLEAWSMTSLRAHTGRPEPGPWLRGWVDDDPQTTVVWRRHLPPRPAGKGSAAREVDRFFEAAPVHTSERVDVRTDRVVSWLTARAARWVKRLEGEAPEAAEGEAAPNAPPDAARGLTREAPVAYRLDSAGEPERGDEGALSLQQLDALGDARGKKRLFRLLMGAVVVVDARIGGLSADGLLDDKEDREAPAADEGAAEWLPPSEQGAPVVRFRVRRMPADAPVGTEAGWRERLRLAARLAAGDEDVAEWLVVDQWRHEGNTEDDRSAASRPQALDEHQAWTQQEAERLADALGLEGELRQVLVVAARMHDEGKRAERWQRAFSAPRDGVYAKTRGPINVSLLDGYRHELGSLPYVEQSEAYRALTEEGRELALHLVAAHHGHARPTIPIGGCDDAPPSQVRARAAQVAVRFCALQERWGPWGLAWLEALLRAADQRASRKNDEEGERPARARRSEGA